MKRSAAIIAALLAALTLSACSESESDTVPEGDPRKKFKADLRGYQVGPGVMIGKDASAYWVQAALAGYKKTVEGDMPARVAMVAPVAGCKLRKPGKDELVANVHIGAPGMATPIFAFSRQILAERTKNYIEMYKNIGEEAAEPSDWAADNVGAVDVVVTETARPVYLVLQAEGRNTLWNIHAGQGTTIAHVAVIGSGAIAVANLDDQVKVELMTGANMTRCGIAPLRKPADHWVFVKNAKQDQSNMFKEAMDRNIAFYRAYSSWFSSNFGFGSETDVIGIDKASQVLVGPLPASLEARIPFKPLAGASVRIAKQDYVWATDKEAYRAKHRALARALAEKMVGGDLKSLYKGS